MLHFLLLHRLPVQEFPALVQGRSKHSAKGALLPWRGRVQARKLTVSSLSFSGSIKRERAVNISQFTEWQTAERFNPWLKAKYSASGPFSGP